MITNDQLTAKIAWDRPPLCWLSPEQQVQVKNQTDTRGYTMGEVIWSTETPGSQFLVLAGNVRLVPNEGKAVRLEPGDWFGDLLGLSDAWKARAASKEVVVLELTTATWDIILQSSRDPSSATEIKKFWISVRSCYQPDFSDSPRPISGYPFVAGLNTAAACLTMLAQYLEMPVQMEWVQRQLRGQRPKDIVNGGEKVGLQMRRLLVDNWQDLQRINFPALLQWQQAGHWVVVYGVRGDRLIVADPVNPSQTCESIPRPLVQESWDGQLWQVEPIKKQDKFNLGWFLPAVWKFRNLLTEVLIASFTLQLLGLATPVITQVIIDKVMVQESLPTLDVMAIASWELPFSRRYWASCGCSSSPIPQIG